jgi:hypothetical protein
MTLITQVPWTDDCPDGIGIYDEGHCIQIVAYSQQFNGVLDIPKDIVSMLGEALIKISRTQD